MIKRYLACMPPGIVVTAFLLLCMQQLVHLGDSAVAPSGSYDDIFIDRISIPPPVPKNRVDPPPQRIDKPVALPESPRTLLASRDRVTADGLPGYPVPLPPAGVTELPAWSDSTLVNIVRVLPQYPIQASVHGRQGHVIVQFDVMSDGSVDNVSIVESSHPVFEKEAIGAALKFRYKPRVVDGEPQPSYGVRTLFRFSMENDYG